MDLVGGGQSLAGAHSNSGAGGASGPLAPELPDDSLTVARLVDVPTLFQALVVAMFGRIVDGIYFMLPWNMAVTIRGTRYRGTYALR